MGVIIVEVLARCIVITLGNNGNMVLHCTLLHREVPEGHHIRIHTGVIYTLL